MERLYSEAELQAAVTAAVAAATAPLLRKIAELEAKIARLERDSSTSSKPPSSDIVKPPKPEGRRGKRRIGGQLGHPKYLRQPFSPEQVTRVEDCRLDTCPECGGRLQPSLEPPKVFQQVELPSRVLDVVEYRAHAGVCAKCGRVHHAPLPDGVRTHGLLGPRLRSCVAYLKGTCHTSYTTIANLLKDVMGVRLSRSFLAKAIRKTTSALDKAYGQLRTELPRQELLHVDETGHREKGKPHWTWCFRADAFTLFAIAGRRNTAVITRYMGRRFRGILCCDYFSAYRSYTDRGRIKVQFCLAHLIRDVKFLTTLLDKVTRNYGQRLLERLRRVFRVLHRRDQMTPEKFSLALTHACDAMVETARRAPPRREAQNIARRFDRHREGYRLFAHTPGVDPTNNLAEQAIRFVVIDRLVTQGTRSQWGREWCSRIWTVNATCLQQGRSVFEFLDQTIRCHALDLPTPSLLPASPSGP